MVSSSIFAFISLFCFPFLLHRTSSTPAATVIKEAHAIAPIVIPLRVSADPGVLYKAAEAVQAKLLEGPPRV